MTLRCLDPAKDQMRFSDRFQPLSLFFFASFFVAVTGLLAWQAFVSPEVQFLAPAAAGQWIVHPNPAPGYRDADFLLHFRLAAAPGAYPVRIAAMRTCEITVNGQTLPKVTPSNWKTPVPYDFGPELRSGDNEVRIRVSTPEAPPALLVEGPDLIRSDERWRVVLPLENGVERNAAVADHGEDLLASRPNVLSASPHFPLWAAAFAAYCLWIAYALVPPRRRPPADAGVAGEVRDGEPAAFAPVSPWPPRAACLLLAGVAAVVQVHNAQVFPVSRGFDPVQHADYVRYVAETWKVPDATMGWEMSQPPLYYAIGAVLYTAFGGASQEDAAMKAVQFFSPAPALAILALAWWMLGILFPSRPRMRALGFAVAASMPALYYMGPQISNELFSAMTIGTAICVAARQAARGDERWRDALGVGVACGLGLLSKYTGLFVFLGVLAFAGLRVISAAPIAGATGAAGEAASASRKRLHHLVWAAVLAAVTLVICGWLYAHNVAKFGDPFVGAWDMRSGFHIVQPPGYRTAAFYTRFGSVFWQQLSRASLASFWDGMYGSLWADIHGVFLQRDDVQVELLSSLCLGLGLLPSVAILFGFGLALRHLLTHGWNHPYFILVVTSVLTVAAMLSFTLQHPWYSALKAHWGLSLTPCVAAFAALGLDAMCERLGRLRWALYANLAVLGALVPWLFWYRGGG